MAVPFTIGIEEEFQMVDRQTGQLSQCIHTILEKGRSIFGEQLKAEMLQSMVEINSDIMPDISTAREEMRTMRAKLAHLMEEEGLSLISAGTHPTSLWQNQYVSQYVRYAELEDEYQDVARSILIFGQHVHIGVENQEAAVTLMNQVRTWLPHLLAISTNSPFWAGRYTGLKSYRSAIWKPFPVAEYLRYFLHGVTLIITYRLSSSLTASTTGKESGGISVLIHILALLNSASSICQRQLTTR